MNQLKEKKLSSYIFIIIIVILMTFNICLLIKTIRLENCNQASYKFSNKFDLFENQLFEYSSHCLISLNKNVYLHNLQNKDTILVSKVFYEPKVVLYISEFSCNTCLDSAIFWIENNIDKNDLVYLVEYENNAWLNQLNLRTREISSYKMEKNIGITFDNNNPVYFFVDNNLMAKCFYMPIKSDKILIFKYFAFLKRALYLTN